MPIRNMFVFGSPHLEPKIDRCDTTFEPTLEIAVWCLSCNFLFWPEEYHKFVRVSPDCRHKHQSGLVESLRVHKWKQTQTCCNP